ncbi:MAG: GNAT family N-acetyltransferase [Gammaproteobacteria bacterium]|nr:GNAT family N-acetyltransferase [Gammaproteobacteria bacterium]MDH5651330.1 GNAT family N-acetyltransferase [Gammaproteobacteria bacterium]
MHTATQTTPSFRIEALSDTQDLHAHAAAWNRLAQQTTPHLPTCSADWLITWYEFHADQQPDWCCLFVWQDDSLVGVMPLVLQHTRRSGLQQDWLALPRDEHTIAVSPLLYTGMETAVLHALLTAVWARFPTAQGIEMNDIAPDASVLPCLRAFRHRYIAQRTAAYLPCHGEQATYQTSLSKNFRSNQRKAENKLKKMTGVEFEFLTGTQATAQRLDQFMPVEGAGWKGERGTAIQESNELIAFYRSLTKRLATSGRLEWHFLHAEGKAIAANLAIRFGHAVIVWKLGYDEAYEKCSPGKQLFQKLIDRCFADADITEINMLTEADWYNKFNMQRRNFHHIRLYRPGRLSVFLCNYWPDTLITTLKRNPLLRRLVRQLRRTGNTA